MMYMPYMACSSSSISSCNSRVTQPPPPPPQIYSAIWAQRRQRHRPWTYTAPGPTSASGSSACTSTRSILWNDYSWAARRALQKQSDRQLGICSSWILSRKQQKKGSCTTTRASHEYVQVSPEEQLTTGGVSSASSALAGGDNIGHETHGIEKKTKKKTMTTTATMMQINKLKAEDRDEGDVDPHQGNGTTISEGGSSIAAGDRAAVRLLQEEEEEEVVVEILRLEVAACSKFEMPLHYPRFSRAEYERMPEWQLDGLLQDYGLPTAGTLHHKQHFAMATFLWT